MKDKMKSVLFYGFVLAMIIVTTDILAQGNDCGEMPQGLTEINREQAQLLLSNYTQSQKLPCLSGTWTDAPYLTYLACLSRTGLFSGMAQNSKGCLFVIWAVEMREGENVSYRYFALQSDLDCSDPNRGGSGTCPTRCP